MRVAKKKIKHKKTRWRGSFRWKREENFLNWVAKTNKISFYCFLLSIALAMEKNNIDEKNCTCHSHSKKKHRVSLWCVNILFFSSRSGDGLSVFYIHSSEDFISSFFLLLRMFSYQLKQKRKRYLCKCLLSFFHFLLFPFSSAKLLFSSSSSLSLGRWGSTQLEICFIFPFNHNFHLNMFHFPTVPKFKYFLTGFEIW